VSAGRFSETAAGYAATMAPSLRPIADVVVRGAALRPGERVLDVGTGTGNAAAAALGSERRVTGIDNAAGMLAIARRDVPGATFEEMDFGALRFHAGTFDVVLSVHALLFADDRVGALREWRRVTRPGGRLSLSVPGPTDVTPTAIYREIYERYGIDTGDRYPTPDGLGRLVSEAGWRLTYAAADPTVEIRLADDDAFRLWRSIGSRGSATAGWSAEQHAVLTAEMLAATPRTPGGGLRIPFGALYAAAENPA
jgi:SAM-dependent methyltransferase